MPDDRMLGSIEDRFAGVGRTPKGCRARRTIFRATVATVGEVGLRDTSLEQIADRAGLTQAALRHYFATREELLSDFFTSATEWLQEQVGGFLKRKDLSPRERLERCIGWHLEYMESVDTAFWLEASAYWLRQPQRRQTRDRWYRWLVANYAAVIGELRPTLDARERQRRGYCVLTLVLGAWITHGKGSAVLRSDPATERRQLLLDAAMGLALR